MEELKDSNDRLKIDGIPSKRLISKRDIGIEAFELGDGNLLLEATLLDPYHLIRLDIEIEPQTKTIRNARSTYTNYPHASCYLVAEKAKLMIGLKIERGITKMISQRIGGSEGCVHLRELALETINFAATTLIGYDNGFGLMSRDFNLLAETRRFEISKKLLKNTCFIYKGE
ncbi:MAG: DUF2889 domain-containing protein [Bacteroidales bacterium]|jgi:hypothetical protein|nr:DUF2889 domain-containing protein [Bacteroidales bacterium]